MSKQTITHQWVRGAEDGLWFVAIRVEEDGESWYRFPGSAGYYTEADVDEFGPELPNPGTKPVDGRVQGWMDVLTALRNQFGRIAPVKFLETQGRRLFGDRWPDFGANQPKADDHD